MIEPYTEEEREYIQYLIRKYLPSLYVREDSADHAVMFGEDEDQKVLGNSLPKE